MGWTPGHPRGAAWRLQGRSLAGASVTILHDEANITMTGISLHEYQEVKKTFDQSASAAGAKGRAPMPEQPPAVYFPDDQYNLCT